MSHPTAFPVFDVRNTNESEFVAFWSSKYIDRREDLYKQNIGKRLTSDRLWALFTWKNGGPIAAHKKESITRHYIAAKPTPPAPTSPADQVAFICEPGGAIWRIFWLHCHAPRTYPIFDQHVYRAMKQLTTGHPHEIPGTNRAKAVSYVTEYLPFHRSFAEPDKKHLDEALWAYGKFLASAYAA